MQSSNDDSDVIPLDFIETETSDPVNELSNFLMFITKILNCSHGWELSALCKQVENMEMKAESNINDTLEPNLNEKLIILESSEVKQILLCDDAMKTSLKDSVDALLEFLLKKIENFKRAYHRCILETAAIICNFLKACEMNQLPLVKNCALKEFLDKLIYILADLDESSFFLKAPVYQLIAKLIGCFKEVAFARRFVLHVLSQKLNMFNTFLDTQLKLKNNDMYFYENFLLYLTTLKEFLEYNLQQSVLNSIKASKPENNSCADIRQSLSKIIKKSPYYVQRVIQDCLSLLS